jgi:hypothetical protein
MRTAFQPHIWSVSPPAARSRNSSRARLSRTGVVARPHQHDPRDAGCPWASAAVGGVRAVPGHSPSGLVGRRVGGRVPVGYSRMLAGGRRPFDEAGVRDLRACAIWYAATLTGARLHRRTQPRRAACRRTAAGAAVVDRGTDGGDPWHRGSDVPACPWSRARRGDPRRAVSGPGRRRTREIKWPRRTTWSAGRPASVHCALKVPGVCGQAPADVQR